MSVLLRHLGVVGPGRPAMPWRDQRRLRELSRLSDAPSTFLGVGGDNGEVRVAWLALAVSLLVAGWQILQFVHLGLARE